MVTHDLRTPLGTVNNVFDFLNQGQLGDLTEKGQRFVSSGLRNTARMMSLVNDLLDIEKIKSGNFEIDFDEVEVNSLLSGCADLHATQASSQGIELAVAETETIVWGEKDKLLRLLSNLVGNAIKFTPAGGKISLAAEEKDGKVRVSVKDTGPGIPKDKLDAVFERYHQVDGEHKAGGSGLGLAICKMFAEAHGGRIWVESEEGKGSEFILVLPSSKPS
jgi:signal transduction histidine kinase